MPQTLNGNGQATAVNELLRSTEVSEIISSRPGFMVRWGISIFFWFYWHC